MTDTPNERAKLVNVLRRTARMAQQAEWTGGDDDAAAFCAAQYNRVRDRLAELDESVGVVFKQLPEDSSLTVSAMACRQLAAYYEDEVETGHGWGRVYGAAFDTDSFKAFWQQCASDVEDLGEYVRESVESWAKERKERGRQEGSPAEEKDEDGTA